MNDKWAIARTLDEIAKYLELREPNPFKARAFEKAARAIETSEADIEQLVLNGQLDTIGGIGKAIGPIVAELVTTGQTRYLENLREEYPPAIFDLLRVPSLGLKKIGILHKTLGIGDLDDLESAARDGRITSLKGFGPKMQEKILQGIDIARRRQSSFLLPKGLEIAEALREQLATIETIDDAEVTGSIRRRLEVASNVEIAVSTSDAKRAIEAVRKRALLDRIEAIDEQTVRGVARDEVEVTLHFAEPRDFGTAVLMTTGSVDFVEAFSTKIASNGFEFRGKSLRHHGKRTATATEHDVFERTGIPYLDPERREDGEELKRKKRTRLVQPADLRGTFHIHTTYSDGRNSILEMLSAARERGYEYAGISDHSQNAFYARGLTEADLRRQQTEIGLHETAVAPMRVFRGTEADILNDGAIDYGPEILQKFDFVVASVHSRFGMEKDEMTARLLRALDDPFVTFLGHLTGRLLLARDGYTFDLDRIFDRAAERGVIIEINGSPRRLELDWRLIRRALDRGVTFSIHPDAHSVRELQYVINGTWVARKGGLPPEQIFNTRPPDDVAAALANRRKRALATLGKKKAD
jgi:DNA polymerase (family X)